MEQIGVFQLHKIYAQKGIYDENFFEEFSGSASFIKPASTVSDIIFDAIG